MKSEKTYPRKKATVHVKVKPVTHKAKHNPPVAKPIVKKEGNPNWTAEKAERKAMKHRVIVGRKLLPQNQSMADATEQYAIECCWESIAAGNKNAWEALKAILPNKGVSNPPMSSPDELIVERIAVNNVLKAKDGLAVEFGRLEKNFESAKARLETAHKNVSIAKMMVTKARKAYTNAGEDKQERFERMVERNRHLRVLQVIETKAQQEYTHRWNVMQSFAATWDSEEEKLNEQLKKAYDKLDAAKRAKKHEKLQETLEDVFSQRYERAEKVPEKEDSDKYKVYSVKETALYPNEIISVVEMMNELAMNKPAGYLAMGRALASKLFDIINNEDEPFIVNVKDCTKNNVTRSQISDIVGVKYGKREACKEIISVNYNLTNMIKAHWEFLADNYDMAQEILHQLRVRVAKRLLTNGVKLIDEEVRCDEATGEITTVETELNYDMMASSPSQQKKGQAYFCERETLKHSEKLLEFGWQMEDAIAHRTDNAAEWLKRNATLMTPSKVIKGKDGEPIRIMKVLMMKDVDIERWFDKVKTIDGTKLSKAEKKQLKLTMFDGQAVWLKPGMPTTQGRGTALKYMAVALPDYELPEFAIDIMDNKVRVADYDILMTKSCWKASKMGMNWYEYREMVTELAKKCPGYDVLRSVRYSDREIGDEENPRNMARQLTQQFVKVPEDLPEKLTRKTRRWLKSHKNYWTLLSKLGEWERSDKERSPLARLFNAVPQLVVHPYIKQWLKTWWDAKRDKACSGRLRTKGMYPYIVQDPIAMIQILLEGRDPNEKGLGVVPEGFVNLPKVTSGRKVFAIRYPANYLVGMVLRQVNVPEFRELGNVAVLSYYGDTITRADGDFDGDEMLFIFDDLVIETMENIISQFNPPLIDFPHGKLPCDTPFGTREKFIEEIAEALVRAQEYNLVGVYSNLAVICLQQASLAKDGLTCAQWLNAAQVAHVGAIVCLDMVKGAAVPEELKALLKKQNREIRKKFKMPWNQLFSHKELGIGDVMARTNSTQDRIAGCIYDDVGKFDIEFADGERVIEWNPEVFEMMKPINTMPKFRQFIISKEDLRVMYGCKFEDVNDKMTWNKLENGEKVSLREWLMLGWHNVSSAVWKMKGVDMAEKRSELYWYLREMVIQHIRTTWTRDDGYEWKLSEKYARMVEEIVRMAFAEVKEVAPDKRGSFAMFVLNVFAEDILCVVEKGRFISEEIAKLMCAPREKEPDYVPSLMNEDISEEELMEIMGDGSMYLSSDEEYEGNFYMDEDYCA